MKVLITGGAGYVGSSLVPMLLERNMEVAVVDKLMHGGNGLLGCFKYPHFSFIRGDIDNRKVMEQSLQGKDLVVHLAAYVGYPICKKHPEDAARTNWDASASLDELRGSLPLVYSSTCSNYGIAENEICDENTPLNPVTLYGVTKSKAEKLFHESGNSVCLRFATAFGVSPRLRLDLLVNDFCYRAKVLKSLIVYEGHFRRPFVHVSDIARAILFSIDNYDRMKNEVFNVGSDTLNVTKAEVANKIREKIDFYLHFAEIAKDEDQRNYDVSFKKIMALGYRPLVSLEQGIDELLAAMDIVEIGNPYSNV